MVDKQLAAFLRVLATVPTFHDPLTSTGQLLDWADQIERQGSGFDPEMGFILEGANEGECAAYDHGCHEAQAWLDRMLHEPLALIVQGAYSSDKVSQQRKAIVELRCDAERWRKFLRHSFNTPAATTTAVAPFARTKEEHDTIINHWMDAKP